MDFMTVLPRTLRKHDTIMVLVNRLRKVAHFIQVRATYLSSEVAQVFIREIVRLHGVPNKIVSERYANFTSKIWKELFVGLGSNCSFSTTYDS